MEKIQAGDKRKYAERLQPESRHRYNQKLLAIDGNDPYEIPNHSWSLNPEELPELTYISIVNYFVLGKSAYTCEQFRAYKSLESYRLFVAGWVRDVKSYTPDGCQNTVITAKVLHSMRLNEKPLQPWITVTADGSSIISAHCTCMAGVGETCTHVGALAFAVDAFSQTKEKATCTGVAAYWKVPQGVKGVTPSTLSSINFTSAAAQKKTIDSFIQDENAVAPDVDTYMKPQPEVPLSTGAEISQLFSDLKAANQKPVSLKVLPETCSDFRCDPENSATLPASLRTLLDVACDNMALEELQEHCSAIPIDVSDTECQLIEKGTRQQSRSPSWFAARAGRVTASNLHAVCHTPHLNPSVSLVKKICYPERHMFQTEATKWGICNEGRRLQMYFDMSKGQHKNFTMKRTGLILSPKYLFMGASPDAMVNCDCHGSGCVELKCPFKHKDSTIEQAASDPGFCLHSVDGVISMRKGNPYYSQVQCQLFLSGALYCDFLVWTNIDIQVVRVLPEQVFWDECVEKAAKLFRCALLPELVGNWTDRKDNPHLAKKKKAGSKKN